MHPKLSSELSITNIARKVIRKLIAKARIETRENLFTVKTAQT